MTRAPSDVLLAPVIAAMAFSSLEERQYTTSGRFFLISSFDTLLFTKGSAAFSPDALEFPLPVSLSSAKALS